MESLFTPRAASTHVPPEVTPTTDFALIESQKENIRPLASGRSAAALSSVFEKSDKEKVIQEGHDKHRRDIEEAERRDREGEEMMDGVQDVLEVYSRYISFTAQHHPTSASHILPLLESTTRRFVNDARYAQDIRHLNLWVMFSRHIERKEEIWAFLESKDVGTRHSLFYEEWATAAEGLGRKKKADDIYKLGLARKAAPVERLKTRHQAFLARIMAPPSGDIPDDEPRAVPSHTPSRTVLGQSGVASSGSITGAVQLAPSTRISKGHNGSKLEIFADANGPGVDGPVNEWEDFGTRDGRRKENVVEPTPWKGETLPQKRVAPRTPKLEVFKDSNDNEGVRAADEVFSRSRAPLTEAELLKADPLRNYDTSSLSTAVPTVPSLPAPPSARKPPRPKPSSSSHFVMEPWECPTDGPEVKDAKGKVQRRMFDWNQVFKNGEEWSFEEVRARQRGLLGKEWKGEVKGWEVGWHKPGSSTPKKEEKKKLMPSPTVNTKLANEEVAMMFDQTIHGSKIRDSDSESDEDDSDVDEDEAPAPSAPTPLPAPAAMLRPTAGMVPPTPTPAGAFGIAARALTSPAVYADENAIPSSAAKPGRFNVFSETPAKTPLAARTPLASSSSIPRAFGVFQEEPAQVESTPSAKGRAPLGSVNIFATPALTDKMPERRVLSHAIPEEAEEAEEVEADVYDAPNLIDEVVEERYVNINDEDEEEEPRPRRGGRFQIHEMTPITERTCEFTQMTSHRMSLPGGDSQSRRTSSVNGPGHVTADEAFVASQPITEATGLSAVVEEDERSGSSRSPRTSFDKSLFDVSPSGNRSGSMTTGFNLPEGYTIHGRGGMNVDSPHTMVVVDSETNHSTREGSPETETEAFVTAQHGQLLPNPCIATDEEVLATLLASIEPPLSDLPGFHDYRSTSFRKIDALQKFSKNKVRRNSAGSSRVSIAPEEGYTLDLAGKAYEVRDKIGEGGFGAVFLGIDIAARQEQDDADSDEEDEDDDAEDKCKVAIKVEKPSAMWEAVILDRIQSRLDNHLRPSIVRSRSLYAFADESYLLLDYSAQGTLLDVVNKASTMGIAPATTGAPSAVDEMVAIFFTIELLRTIEGLHRAKFIHGDLKIDNCLVRLESIPNSAWSTTYSPLGEEGWEKKGIKLIDFGRGIDLSLFPGGGDGQTFVADWPTDQRDCPEVREGRPWSYQTDYHGLASVCYCMLYGKFIGTEVVPDSDPVRYKIDQPLKRYWQSDLWSPLFDTLLNSTLVRPDGELPITDELTVLRAQFEEWLVENCQKGGKSLRAMLKKIELAALTGRRL